MTRPVAGAPMPNESWAQHAACRHTTVPFHPQPEQNRRHWDKQAKNICATCPVTQPCLEHALTWHEVGVWGNTNESERKRIRQANPTLYLPPTTTT